jgi:putative exosortase-associated protein (TIGR04073 family)
MQPTPSRRTLLVTGLAVVLLAAGAPPAAASEETTPAPLAKLTRGIANVVLGLPGEVLSHVVNGAHGEKSIETAGGYTAGFLSGLFMGIGWGAARVGSGLVDVVTFPVPFDDNRPLLEPDYVI